MKTSIRIATASLCTLAAPAALLAAKAGTDILPPLRRQVSVKLAQSFANPAAPAPVPADLPSPFNPPDFEKADPAEARGNVATGGQPPSGPGGADSARPVAPASDRAVLERVAALIPARGVIVLRGKPILTVEGGKRFEIGSTFTVSYDDQDYDLEVIAIDRTTFTLRYRGEEITRAIRLTK